MLTNNIKWIKKMEYSFLNILQVEKKKREEFAK